MVLLGGSGNPLMAKVAVANAAKELGIEPTQATPEEFEHLVEEVMKSYRMFCTNDEMRRRLWIELVEMMDQ
jgi:tripartite-type tricarboxylate transporter receptor subunit TctC